MMRRGVLVCLIVLMVSSVFGLARSDARSAAVDHPPAYTRSLLAVATTALKVNKTSAGTPIGAVEKGERLIVDGRNKQNTWWHVYSSAGVGYVSAANVTVTGDTSQVPVVNGTLPAPQIPDGSPVDDLTHYPLLPSVSDFTKTIFKRGQTLGNAPDIFTEAGDCMTADSLLFLGQINDGVYDLGPYSDLQDVITFYSKPKQLVTRVSHPMNSFEGYSDAAHTGYTAESVEDSTWSDPKICQADETPLQCEFRQSKPAVVLIMFGTNDVTNLTETEFDFYLRLVVHDSIDAGVIPLMSTFPGDPAHAKKSLILNQIVYNVAHDYDVPVMNLWAAIQPLPGHGRQPDSAYLTRPPNTTVTQFTPDSLQYGYTMRNLITLQSLSIVYKAVIAPALN
jgi:hypothetical protein